MLNLDLKAFAQCANWDRLPEDVASRHFELTASSSRFPGAVLPAVSASGETYFYAVAATRPEWRDLQPLLLAYAGPTVTTFTGRTSDFNLDIAPERVLQAARVEAMATLVPGRDSLLLATQALDRLRKALEIRPRSRPPSPETTADILAQLEMSIAAGDRPEANRILNRLRAELRLDSMNLHFLEVRILWVFSAWTELVGADWFKELRFVRKPAAVAAAMLEALWHVYLGPYAADAAQLMERYQQAVRPLALPLLVQAPTDGGEVIERIRALESIPPTAPELPAARAQDLLHQAAEAPSNTRLASAHVAIESLPPGTRQTLLSSAAGQEALAAAGSLAGPFPTDWSSWLDGVSDPSFVTAVAVAREGVAAWPVQRITSTEDARPIAEKLLNVGLATGFAKDRLMQRLPSLVLWVKQDPGYPRAELGEIYEALIQLFAVLERRGASAREAAADLLDAILSIGTDAVHYRQLLRDFAGVMDEGAGQSSIYWLIDVAATLLQHPAPDVNARLALVNRILASLQPFLGRLTVGQRVAYDRIASGASWPPLVVSRSPDSEGPAKALAGKTIAIYTLTESAGQQAEAALQAMIPTARIELARDHVASPRLARLSRDADVFVLAAASAKHAATDCILGHRGDKPLLYAAGRGFSSIVRAVEDFVDQAPGVLN
jgi:hypothetical protein